MCRPSECVNKGLRTKKRRNSLITLPLASNFKGRESKKSLITFFWFVKSAKDGKKIVIGGQRSFYPPECCSWSPSKLIRIKNSNTFHYFRGKTSIIRLSAS